MNYLYPANRLQALFSLAFLLLLCGCEQADFTTHQQQQGRFTDYQGRWLLINYWAEWCKPCIEEIPELNHFAQTHSQQVALLGVNYDQVQAPLLQQQIAQLGIEFPVLLNDPAAHFGQQRPSVLPTTLLIDPQGNFVKALLGPQNEASLKAAISTDN